jgi:hypothetical protein
LAEIAASTDQLAVLAHRLDSLGHNVEAKTVAECDDRFRISRTLRFPVDAFDEVLVDLENFDREAPQIAEGGLACAKVVDGDGHS